MAEIQAAKFPFKDTNISFKRFLSGARLSAAPCNKVWLTVNKTSYIGFKITNFCTLSIS
jgi:hypothetical protein